MPKREIYLLFGPPGSGKTVQASYLAKQLRLDHISWGYICREPAYGLEYSEKIKDINDPRTTNKERAEIITWIMDLEMKKIKDSPHSLVIDGFPRHMLEARHLVELIKKHGYSVKSIININPSLGVACKRCTERLVCSTCKKYYDDFVPPKNQGYCDKDNVKLVRFDVDKEQIKKDFFDYGNEVIPIIEYLKPYAKSCFSVSGDDDEIITFSNILLKLKNGVRGDYNFFKKTN